MEDTDPWRDEPPGVAERRMESLYTQRPEPTQIQCSRRSLVGQCVNEAYALVVRPHISITDAFPPMCVACCTLELEHLQHGGQILFERLKR